MKQCYFCSNKIDTIDYKDAYLLRRFMNSLGKIYPPKKHGTCAKHQRSLTTSIKRARIMALVPFTTR
ncbi:MAG: 30S ribosomal protein S18 [Candidatus Moraniibacteriota bacterium]|nr:MAG: 30S ribosomal protein S18 [Candidatus Moranbacteria bacterium]